MTRYLLKLRGEKRAARRPLFSPYTLNPCHSEGAKRLKNLHLSHKTEYGVRNQSSYSVCLPAGRQGAANPLMGDSSVTNSQRAFIGLFTGVLERFFFYKHSTPPELSYFHVMYSFQN
jgi:hypothetical protein